MDLVVSLEKASSDSGLGASLVEAGGWCGFLVDHSGVQYSGGGSDDSHDYGLSVLV